MTPEMEVEGPRQIIEDSTHGEVAGRRRDKEGLGREVREPGEVNEGHTNRSE